MKRISGGQTSVGADAKLLSSHAGDPRAATGDTTDTSHTGQRNSGRSAASYGVSPLPARGSTGRVGRHRPSARTLTQRPVIRDRQPGGGNHLVSVSRRVSAAGVSLLGHPIPAEELGSPCGRLTGPEVRTSTGLPRFARTSYDRGGCLLYPEDGGAPPGQGDCSTGARRFSAASPCTQLRRPIGWALLYEASTGVHAIHPSGHSPRLWPPGWNGPPLGFPPSFEPRPAEPADARRGGDRPSSTDLAHRLRHQPNLQSRVSTRSVRPRVASR